MQIVNQTDFVFSYHIGAITVYRHKKNLFTKLCRQFGVVPRSQKDVTFWPTL